ncbi:IS66 family insertion sequence element accessory protein TnpB [Sphingomonas hengshuiensis]|uniref:IS66 family insertion sequence element accessory protein TnpB n=1 Tax=Sphingomonas hengshuiensis TaxID=1609977 RepID=UPI00098171B6|nr:IS66 family insertion sequence element accessory protein TnpB [Sphingomonas hengshuiensis]
MPIPLRPDYDASSVRKAACHSKDGAQTRRLLALAAIYEGASRTEAARISISTLGDARRATGCRRATKRRSCRRLSLSWPCLMGVRGNPDRAWRHDDPGAGRGQRRSYRACFAGGEGSAVIIPPGPLKVLVAVKPVDFRKGMVGLAALVERELQRDPFSGIAAIGKPVERRSRPLALRKAKPLLTNRTLRHPMPSSSENP